MNDHGIDGLSTIEGVADFLDREVVAAIAPHLRGEVRAAAKLLRSCALELGMRPREISVEIDELLALCAATSLPQTDAEVLETLRERARGTQHTLREHEALRLEVNELSARTMVRLTGAGDPALIGFLRCLGNHAARRSTWQSVFPGDPAGVQQ